MGETQTQSSQLQDYNSVRRLRREIANSPSLVSCLLRSLLCSRCHQYVAGSAVPSPACPKVPPELFTDRWTLLGEPHKTDAVDA